MRPLSAATIVLASLSCLSAPTVAKDLDAATHARIEASLWRTIRTCMPPVFAGGRQSATLRLYFNRDGTLSAGPVIEQATGPAVANAAIRAVRRASVL
jgi:hypothetical protein